MKINIASTRLAFFLIALLLVLIILSALVPQKGVAEDQVLDWRKFLGSGYLVIEKLGLDAIYFSPLFFILLGLLTVNLVAGNLKRSKIILRPAPLRSKIRQLGIVIFHFSLAVIIVGVILNYLFKFHGVYGLTEGQTVRDSPDDYFQMYQGPLYNDQFERFTIYFDRFDSAFVVNRAQTEAGTIILRPLPPGTPPAEPIKATVLINRPLKWRELEIHFGAKTGYSPEVVLLDSTGKPLFRNFIRLDTRREAGVKIYQDFILLEDYGLKVGIKISPDNEVSGMLARLVTIESEGKIVYDGELAAGDTAHFAGWGLTVPRLRRWCYFEVIKSPFLNLVFFGFWSGLAGMTISLLSRLGGRKAQHR